MKADDALAAASSAEFAAQDAQAQAAAAQAAASESITRGEAEAIANGAVESGFDKLAALLGANAQPPPAPTSAAPPAEPAKPKDEPPKEVKDAKKKRRRFSDIFDGIA